MPRNDSDRTELTLPEELADNADRPRTKREVSGDWSLSIGKVVSATRLPVTQSADTNDAKSSLGVKIQHTISSQESITRSQFSTDESNIYGLFPTAFRFFIEEYLYINYQILLSCHFFDIEDINRSTFLQNIAQLYRYHSDSVLKLDPKTFEEENRKFYHINSNLPRNTYKQLTSIMYIQIEDLFRKYIIPKLNLAKIYAKSSRIDKNKTEFCRELLADLSLDDRFAMLDKFSADNNGKGVSEFVRLLFPELEQNMGASLGIESNRDQFAAPKAPPIPTVAPALWSADRQDGETPPEFAVRVYDQWMGHGLTMADVRRLDEPLAQSLYHHIRKQRPMPEGFDLPTKHQQRERDAAALGPESDAKLREFFRDRQARYRASKKSRSE